MQIKQAQVNEYQNQNLSLANQTVDLFDRLDARKPLEFDPLKPVQKSSLPLLRRIKPAIELEANFEPPLIGRSSGSQIDQKSIAEKSTRLNLDDVLQGIELSRELAWARNAAIRNVEPWRADSELKSAQNGKRAAEGGRYLNEETRIRNIEIADLRLQKAHRASDAAGPTKYAQTVRALRDYAISIDKHVSQNYDPLNKEAFARQLAIDLELMVRAVKNLEKV